MKTLSYFLSICFLLISITAFAQVTSEKVAVSGNCGMCKSRIEKAALSAGAEKASWSVKKKTLKVDFDASKTSLDAIEKAIAAAGHDTRDVKATNESYDQLPGCCQYDRANGSAAKACAKDGSCCKKDAACCKKRDCCAKKKSCCKKGADCCAAKKDHACCTDGKACSDKEACASKGCCKEKSCCKS